MPTALQTKQEELNARRKSWQEIYESGGDERKLSADQVSELKRLNDEMETLGAEVDDLSSIEKKALEVKRGLEDAQRVRRDIPFAGGASDRDGGMETKSLGDLFVESIAYKGWNKSSGHSPAAEIDGIEVKTLMTTSAGFAPQIIRSGRVVDSAQQMPKLVDLVPTVTTSQTGVKYMLETTYTNNAAEVAEGGLIPEAALVYTEETSPVQKIAVNLPVTEEQMEDIDGMRDRINNRLSLMLRQRLDSEVVAGDGNSPNLTGILNTAGILTQSATGDIVLDALLKALVKVNMTTGFVEANGMALHPLDWQDVALTRTDDNAYLFGGPLAPFPMRLWGLAVTTSTYVTQNTGIVGDFANYSELAFKDGITFDVTNSNEDDFKHGILRVRAKLRVAFTIYRPSAFVKITGV